MTYGYFKTKNLRLPKLSFRERVQCRDLRHGRRGPGRSGPPCDDQAWKTEYSSLAGAIANYAGGREVEALVIPIQSGRRKELRSRHDPHQDCLGWTEQPLADEPDPDQERRQ